MENFYKALDENRTRTQLLKMKMIEEENKKRRKENILTFIIAIFILLLTFANILLTNNEKIKQCIDNGYSENYCFETN